MPTLRLYRTGTCTVVTVTQTTSTPTSYHQTTVSEHHMYSSAVRQRSYIHKSMYMCIHYALYIAHYIILCSSYNLPRACKAYNVIIIICDHIQHTVPHCQLRTHTTASYVQYMCQNVFPSPPSSRPRSHCPTCD